VADQVPPIISGDLAVRSYVLPHRKKRHSGPIVCKTRYLRKPSCISPLRAHYYFARRTVVLF
jgi:hypothetical protein